MLKDNISMISRLTFLTLLAFLSACGGTRLPEKSLPPTSPAALAVPGVPASVWSAIGTPLTPSPKLVASIRVSRAQALVIANQFAHSLTSCTTCMHLFLAQMQSQSPPYGITPLEWNCVVYTPAGFLPPGGIPAGASPDIVPRSWHLGYMTIDPITGKSSPASLYAP